MNFIIKNYVNKLKEEDIVKFGKENGIDLSISEANYLYLIVQNKLDNLLYGDIDEIVKDLEENLGPEKTLKIQKLFLMYKEKYKDYL